MNNRMSCKSFWGQKIFFFGISAEAVFVYLQLQMTNHLTKRKSECVHVSECVIQNFWVHKSNTYDHDVALLWSITGYAYAILLMIGYDSLELWLIYHIGSWVSTRSDELTHCCFSLSATPVNFSHAFFFLLNYRYHQGLLTSHSKEITKTKHNKGK